MAKKRVFQASHIQKELRGKKILSDVSLVMEEGGVYCLMGPSGIGKTTLLFILMGLMKPDKGTLAGFSGARISAVFQEDRLLEEENAVENVALVCDNKADRTKAEALLSKLHILRLMGHCQHGPAVSMTQQKSCRHFPAFPIQPGKRFIQKKQIRRMGHSPAQRYPSFHTAAVCPYGLFPAFSGKQL